MSSIPNTLATSIYECPWYRKNLFMKEKLNKKNNINYIHYLEYTEVILLEKTNQFKHNSLFINLFCLQYYLYQWSWPKIDTLLHVTYLNRYSITK